MKHFLVLFIVVIFSPGCEEVPPIIDFSEPIIALKDTTYIVNQAPAPQHKAVLLEDITGVRCINCPEAAKKVKDIINQKTPDSVVAIALYPIDLLDNFTRPYPDVPQLASELSKEIVGTLGVPQGLPSGYVERTQFPGKSSRNISYNEWISYVNERLKEKTPVNIELGKKIDNRKLKVEVKLQYNKAVSGTVNHKYFIYLLEDNIVSTQLDQSGLNKNYVHNHVLRYSFGLALGNPLKGPFEAGRTFLKEFEIEVPTDYIIANCRLVCAVLDGTSLEIINVREIEI